MTLATDIAQINADGATLHDIVHGPAGATVTTEAGPVPTLAEALSRAAGGNQRGAWVTSTAYAVNDVVTNSGSVYRCTTAHTAGTFATDLAAGKWYEHSTQITDPPTAAGQVAPFILAGFKNLLINARGTINQRGYVSGAATSGSNQYTLDRWRVVTSGQSLSFTASGNTMEITAPAGGVEQVIEGEAIADGSHAINWSGTATCTVNGTARTKGESFTLTGGANCTVRFSGGTFKNPQLEYGTVATPFEQRPIGLETMLCQRYYEKSYDVSTSPRSITQVGQSGLAYFDGLTSVQRNFGGSLVYKVAKRAVPVPVLYSPITGTAGKIRDYANNADVNGFIDSSGTTGFRAFGAQSSPTTSINSMCHWVADSEL